MASATTPRPTFEELEDFLNGARARRLMASARWKASSALFVSTLVIGLFPLFLRLPFFQRRIEKGFRFLKKPSFRSAILAITIGVTAGQLLDLVFSQLIPTMRSRTSDKERFGCGTDIAAGYLARLVFHELVSIRFGYNNEDHSEPWYTFVVRFIRSELNLGRTISEKPGPPDAEPEEEQKEELPGEVSREVKNAVSTSSTQRPHMNFVVYFGVTMLSLDSMFEGLCLGLQPTIKETWLVFGSLLAYRVSMVLITTAQLMASNFASKQIALVIFIVCVMHPAGSLFGASVDHSGVTPRNLGFLVGISAGKLLYVIFYELFKGDKTKYLRRITPVAATSMGFLLFEYTMLSIDFD